MEDKEYKDWLKEAKTELDAYSAQQEELSKLYQQAVSGAEEAHRAETRQLKEEAVRRKNQAATDAMRTSRNLKQGLASRGLAFSGENAQTDVDLTLALQNRLGEIDSETLAQTREKERLHAETVANLKQDQLRHRADTSLALSKLKAELAEKAKDKEEPSAVKGETVPHAIVSNSLVGSAVGALGQVKDRVQSAVKENTVTPEISPKDLAKQLVKAAGGNGSISGYSQSQAMELLLETMNKNYLLDGDYRKQLILNLQSMGYDPDYRTAYAQEVKALSEDAVKAFDLYYDRYFDIYYYAGYTVNESDRMASEQARFLQLAYLYRHSYTVEMFELAVREMGYGSKLNGFYDEIAKDPDSYVLGSEIQMAKD